MAVSVVSHAASTPASSTSIVVPKPSGLAVGHLMLAHLAARANTTISNADFATVGSENRIQGVVLRSHIMFKIADADDVAASDFTFTNGTTAVSVGAITAFTGFDSGTPIDASNGQANTASTTITIPTVTPATANGMAVILVTDGGDDGIANYAIATNNPASWSEQYDVATSLGNDVNIAMGWASRPETSATDGASAESSPTAGSDVSVGHIVFIKTDGITPSVVIPTFIHSYRQRRV